MFTGYSMNKTVLRRLQLFFMANKNPRIDQIEAYTFKTKRKESCTAQLNLRVPPSLSARIKQKENWQEFVRQTLQKALDLESA